MAATWVQKIKPFLDDSKLYVYSGGKMLTDWYGWCLAVADAAFGVAPFAASAIKAWEVNKTKYTGGGMTIPIGIYVPVFYRGGQHGHVVIAYRDAYDHIRVWSSPYTHKAYFDYFEGPVVSTLDNIGKKYGCSYIGWTPTLGNKVIAAWEEIKEATVVKQPEPTPTKDPEPAPEPEQPATEDSSASNSTENKNPGDASEDGVIAEAPSVIEVTEQEANALLKENVDFMEKFQEIIEEAGKGITFKPVTKKIVYILGDLLLLAGTEVTPVMSVINAQSPEALATALTQVLFTAGVGILLIFKLLKAKSGTKLTETIDKTE